MTTDNKKPWDGVFTGAVNSTLEDFSASLETDVMIAADDLRASAAHAQMLRSIGVLSDGDADNLLNGMKTIAKEIRDGRFVWKTELEDVHMNIEARLVELCGEAGKRLHTARSRNDQIATDIRLHLRGQIDKTTHAIVAVQQALLTLAALHTETIMPGYTHFQPAQPIVFAHHLLAWNEALERDCGRLADQLPRLNIMPLGSAALAGTSWPVDREFTARELGFDAASANSLDSVSDRDFMIEFCAGASISMMHLSRMAEEMIIWVNPAFGFIELPDSWCTGSSIMPQKKNPDALELIRGKTGHCYGALISLLTLMKAQPLAYNRDMQEDKPPLLNCARQWLDCLRVMAALLAELRVNPKRMRAALAGTFATATDLADYLVGLGIAFRDAHRITGTIVKDATEQGLELSEMTLENLRQHCPQINKDIYQCLSLEGSIATRRHQGGTAPTAVREALKKAQARIDARTAD
ncbi:MAG: argininosuccinate lyase [Gammaproteobacteria bacterium]|nr:argininosuccinate lyase [Gammaproteobacteria bacterium]